MVQKIKDQDYRHAMGRLLVLYTQIDYLIMRACAERIATAPDEETQLSLAKQVGDECKHVQIQQKWLAEFGTDPTPVLSDSQQALLLQHFRSLGWLDFLTDMYVCAEALGGEAVQQIVPIADPGTRESLRVPLQDEVDHVQFGLTQLRQLLATMPVPERQHYIESISGRVDFLDDLVHSMGLDIPAMFNAVGVEYLEVVDHVNQYRQQILDSLVMADAA